MSDKFADPLISYVVTFRPEGGVEEAFYILARSKSDAIKEATRYARHPASAIISVEKTENV